jgi:hypothetical protein
MTSNKLFLGFRETGETVELGIEALQKHIACFGASGSGKTVACKVIVEEVARAGIPVIAFDPQGDIASLIHPETDNQLLESRGVSPAIRDAYAHIVEVVIWTPGSSKGLPLSINPLGFDEVSDLSAEDRLRFLSASAKNVAGLIGYDTDNDDGKSAESALTVVFEYCAARHISMRSFGELIDLLTDLPESVNSIIRPVMPSRPMEELIRKLRLMTMGSRKLIFETGFPASIEVLLGLDQPENPHTRISVIYLNTLGSQQEKEFFMASITQMLYNWLLRNPLKKGQDGLQALLYIDEIAPFLPPVKMPACKESLMLLFKQARKYGLGCLIATQNPGDIDYKSIAQISTYCIGNLKTNQDLNKIETRLEAIAPQRAKEILTQIPALSSGNFVLLSPDSFSDEIRFRIRWLVTRHDVISEDQLAELVSGETRNLYRVHVKKPEDTFQSNTNPTTTDTPDNHANTHDAGKKTSEQENGDLVLIAAHRVFEADLFKKINPFLPGKFFGLIRFEKLQEASFDYMPIIKIEMIYTKRKSWFSKQLAEIPLNLYLDYRSYEIVTISSRTIRFEPMARIEPHKIEDFDQRVHFIEEKKENVGFDFRKLGRKLDQEEVSTFISRKYNVRVQKIRLVLLPVWDCLLSHKQSAAQRRLLLDACLAFRIEHKTHII